MPATFPRCNHFRILGDPERRSEYLRCTRFDFPESSFRKYTSTKITCDTKKSLYKRNAKKHKLESRRNTKSITRSDFTGDPW